MIVFVMIVVMIVGSLFIEINNGNLMEIRIQQNRFNPTKFSPDPSHFMFEINVGKGRNRHKTTPNLNLRSILRRFRNSSLNFRFVVCRIRFFPTLI